MFPEIQETSLLFFTRKPCIFLIWAEKSLCHMTQGRFFLGFSDFKKGERIIDTLCISYGISITHRLEKSLYIV